MAEFLPLGSWRPLAQRPWEALGGLVLGISLFLLGYQHSLIVFLLALPAAVLAVGSSTGLLLWRGDVRLPEALALSGLLALLPALALLLSMQWLGCTVITVLAVVTWLGAGRIALHSYPVCAGAPVPTGDLANAGRVGTDLALLAWFKLLMRTPQEEHRAVVRAEVGEWQALTQRQREARHPDFREWHPTPPDLVRVDARERQLFSLRYRHISWDSGFARADAPGGARWQKMAANARAHAWVLEHPGKPRPWLLTIHGYRMGSPLLDMRAFEPNFLHRRLGLNVASMVLPLHGPRRHTRWSGGGYLEGDFSHFVHAQCQAMWDLRRLLSWLRLNRHAPAIGVYGLSLGGYNASLLAGLDDDLACVIAGIPVFDMALTLWRHLPLDEARMLAAEDIGLEQMRGVFAPVTPAYFPARPHPSRLGIFAGNADELVWPDQPLALARHWKAAPPYWFPGAHLSFAGTPAQRQCLLDTLKHGQLI